MKKAIYILLTALLSLTLIGAKAQETPPSGLKSVNAQFYINLADSSVWQNKGLPYGWQRVARYKDIILNRVFGNSRMDSLFARAVDLYTPQTVGGNKTFTGAITYFNNALSVYGIGEFNGRLIARTTLEHVGTDINTRTTYSNGLGTGNSWYTYFDGSDLIFNRYTGASLTGVIKLKDNGNIEDGAGKLFLKTGSVPDSTTIAKNIQKPNKINNASIYNAYGDSFTNSNNASTFPLGYMPLLSNFLGYADLYNNYALSGSGVWNAIRQNNINENVGHSAISSVMVGFNDIRRGGSGVKTLAKIINAHRAIFVNHNLLRLTAAGATATGLTRTGTWTTGYTASTYAGKTANGASSATSGDNITYVFPEDNVVIGAIGADGTTYNYGTFSVTIDGVSKGSFTLNGQTDAISDGVNDNGRSPYVLMFAGLGDGNHTLVITLTSSTLTPIDYIGHLKQPASCTPLIIGLIAKMDATGYAVAPANATAIIADATNTAISAEVATWGSNYPNYVIDPNKYYNLTTGLSSDHIHPNDIGHRQIFQAWYEGASSFQKSIPQPLSKTDKPTFAGAIFTASPVPNAQQTIDLGSSSLNWANTYSSNFRSTGNMSVISAGFINSTSSVANGSTAVAFNYNTGVSLTTAGAKIARWQNSSVDKASIDKDGVVNSQALTASSLLGSDASKNIVSITVLPSGTTATTQTAGDNSTKVATTAFAGSIQNFTASGTGALTAIVIPHGLSGISGTSKVIVQPLNAASAGVTYVTIDATNVTVNYTVAPLTGTNNLSYTIHIKP